MTPSIRSLVDQRDQLNRQIEQAIRKAYPVGTRVRYFRWSQHIAGRITDHIHDGQVLIKSGISNRVVPVPVTAITETLEGNK
jgi:hypothetical protein